MTTGPTHEVRLAVVSYSSILRQRLRDLFDKVPDVQVVGEAISTGEALSLVEGSAPTAILIDRDLPQPGVVDLVGMLMRHHRVPIVVLADRPGDSASTIEIDALRAGAVAITIWAPGDSQSDKTRDQELIRTIRAMSEVKVVRRRISLPASSPAPPPDPVESETTSTQPVEIIAVGASTGGPSALEAVLSNLSQPLPVPVVSVQHLSAGHRQAMAQWLTRSTGISIRVGEQGMRLSPGTVYLAPDDAHIEVNASARLVLSKEPAENGSRPSVSVLFRSVNKHYGPRAIGVLLTGMGRDGALELREMRERGALTIAQDEESSVIHGMPGEAIRLGGACHILPPDRIAATIERRIFGASRDPGRRSLSEAKAI